MTSEQLSGFDEHARTCALERMRAGCVRALEDAQTWTGPLSVQAQLRAETFAQAASDLAGTSMDIELARASGTEDDKPWQWAAGH